jgi:gliding motility-associated lipoprotein GldD
MEKPIPKPSGYYRISFLSKSYQPVNAGYPYTFDIPAYAGVEKDPSAHADPTWINIVVPQHKAEIHLSYKHINGNLHIFTEESRELAYEHTLKASSIEEKIWLHPAEKVSGTIYYIRGNAASPLQFYMTDSVRHFLRGALYIRATPNIDSLKPVIEYLEKDVIRLIETLRWNN